MPAHSPRLFWATPTHSTGYGWQTMFSTHCVRTAATAAVRGTMRTSHTRSGTANTQQFVSQCCYSRYVLIEHTSAVQLACLSGTLDDVNADQGAIYAGHCLIVSNSNNNIAVAAYVHSLQQADGSFAGDDWGEVDTRYACCAVLSLSLLGRIEAIDSRSAGDYLRQCQNRDGGFGVARNTESHAGELPPYYLGYD